MVYDTVIDYKYPYSRMHGEPNMTKRMEDLDQESIIVEVIRHIHTWDQKDQDYFFTLGYEDSLITLHHSFGRWIRNTYRLWDYTHTPEIVGGVDYSKYHPDAVSMEILRQAWKRGLPINE